MKENKNTFKPVQIPAGLHQQIKKIAVDKQAKIYEIIKELLENYKNKQK
mgnify:CR=1 FL=1